MFSGFFGAILDATASVKSDVALAAVFTQQADTLFCATLTIIGVFVLRTLVLPALRRFVGWGLSAARYWILCLHYN